MISELIILNLSNPSNQIHEEDLLQSQVAAVRITKCTSYLSLFPQVHFGRNLQTQLMRKILETLQMILSFFSRSHFEFTHSGGEKNRLEDMQRGICQFKEEATRPSGTPRIAVGTRILILGTRVLGPKETNILGAVQNRSQTKSLGSDTKNKV